MIVAEITFEFQILCDALVVIKRQNLRVFGSLALWCTSSHVMMMYLLCVFHDGNLMLGDRSPSKLKTIVVILGTKTS